MAVQTGDCLNKFSDSIVSEQLFIQSHVWMVVQKGLAPNGYNSVSSTLLLVVINLFQFFDVLNTYEVYARIRLDFTGFLNLNFLSSNVLMKQVFVLLLTSFFLGSVRKIASSDVTTMWSAESWIKFSGKTLTATLGPNLESNFTWSLASPYVQVSWWCGIIF